MPASPVASAWRSKPFCLCNTESTFKQCIQKDPCDSHIKARILLAVKLCIYWLT